MRKSRPDLYRWINSRFIKKIKKIKNCTNLELSDAIKSDIIKDILTCLGCGIGDHFNINNLRYNRIIILTDADPKISIGVK